MKKIILVLALGAIIGGGIGFYLFNKKVESLKNKKPDFSVSAQDMYSAFEKDDTIALLKYKDKVLEVSGEIEKVEVTDSNYTVLLKAPGMGNIKCAIDPVENKNVTGYDSGSTITLKCTCTGINKMEELGLVILDVELTGCVIN